MRVLCNVECGMPGVSDAEVVKFWKYLAVPRYKSVPIHNTDFCEFPNILLRDKISEIIILFTSDTLHTIPLSSVSRSPVTYLRSL
jgi:hypothetical protein